jgi:hypothetical protein
MNKIIVSGLLAAAIMMPQTANAAPDFSRLPIDQICRADGSLNAFFASNGKRKAGAASEINQPLDASFAPFADAMISYTRFSNRLVSTSFTTSFDDGKNANLAADQLARLVEARGWIALEKPEKNSDEYAYLFAIKAEAGDVTATTLGIVAYDDSLIVTCQNSETATINDEEAGGKMPVGSPRPDFADYAPEPVSFTPADCDNPGRVEELQIALNASSRSFLSPNWSRVAYEDDLASWKIMKLTSSGKIDYDTVSGKIIALIDTPETEKDMQDAAKMLEDHVDAMQKLEPNDQAGMCRLIFAFEQRLNASLLPDPNASGDGKTRAWRATHQLLDAEAKRLGVSFEG